MFLQYTIHTYFIDVNFADGVLIFVHRSANKETYGARSGL